MTLNEKEIKQIKQSSLKMTPLVRLGLLFRSVKLHKGSHTVGLSSYNCRKVFLLRLCFDKQINYSSNSMLGHYFEHVTSS